MTKSAMTAFVFASLALSGLATPATAQTLTNCPASYDLVAGVCIKTSNGDVVLARVSEQALRVTFTDSNCRQGYGILMGNLCTSAKTGDIEFADANRNTVQVAGQVAGK